MYCIGWTFTGVEQPEQAAAVIDLLPGLVRDKLNLCASVGCGCEVPEQPTVCSVDSLSWPHPLVRFTGPTWCIVAVRVKSSVDVVAYLSDKPISREVRDFEDAIKQLGPGVAKSTRATSGF